MTAVRNVKGMRDLLPPETALWQAVEAVVRDVFSTYGYAEIRTPIVEETELFVSGVGEGTDIVGKEMYTFADRKGRSLTLRPESTAAVARAYVQHRLQEWPAPVKLFYIGPQFRYERPQKGRYRQFAQIGAELIGDPGPWTDVELLAMLVRFLRRLGFADPVVSLNTVGDPPSRARFAAALREFLAPHRDELSADSLRRLHENPLRILDSKSPGDRELLVDAPRLAAYLSPECKQHFAAVRAGLDAAAISYVVAEHLVRGLDYYTRTVFEITSAELGAQDALLGGGRYDGLIEQLGGPPVPGIGFAIGQDRLIEVLPESFRRTVAPQPPVVVLAAGSVDGQAVLCLAEELRGAGQRVVAELSGASMRSGLKRADRVGARWVVILGDEEVKAGQVMLRDLVRGEQREVSRTELIDRLVTADAETVGEKRP